MNWFSCFVCKKKTSEDIRTLDFNRSSLKEVPPEIFNFERTLENLYLDGNKVKLRSLFCTPVAINVLF